MWGGASPGTLLAMRDAWAMCSSLAARDLMSCSTSPLSGAGGQRSEA